MTLPTPDEIGRFRKIVRKLHVDHEDYHYAQTDWNACYRVTTGRASRGPTWAGRGAPGIRLDRCAFYSDSFFGVTAYVDVQERSFFGLIGGRWNTTYVADEDGPWWDTFRKHLVIWEHEITLPENAPGWWRRERDEQHQRERDRDKARRDVQIKKANRLFRP